MTGSKYAIANDGIAAMLAKSRDVGLDDADTLLALLISTIAEYAKVGGSDAAREALNYELQQLGGDVDTVFLRSR